VKKFTIIVFLIFSILSCSQALPEDVQDLIIGENVLIREVYSIEEHNIVIIIKNGRGFSGDCEIALFSADKKLISHVADRIRRDRTYILKSERYFIFNGYDNLHIYDSLLNQLKKVDEGSYVYSLTIIGDYLYYPREYQSLKRVNLNTLEVFKYPLVETGGGYVYLIDNELYLWYYGPVVYKVSGDNLIKVDPSILDGHERIESEILETTDSEVLREYEKYLGIKRYREN